MSQFSEKVSQILFEIGTMLIEKNKKYGNSALEPLGVFSKLSPEEGLMIRIDDKLKRIKNGSLEKDDEDVINDLIGYLVLLKIHANSKYEPNEALKAAAEKFRSSLGQSTSTNVSSNGTPLGSSWNYTNSKSHNED